jgi:arylsulfatase
MNWDNYKIANYQSWKRKSGWSISQVQAWASFSNTPFKKYKKFVHEGGITSPFVAHWPKGIEKPGRIVSSQYFHLIDIMPTLCDLAGAAYPKKYKEKEITPVEGISMSPWFTSTKAEQRERPVFWQHENHSAVRLGEWKLVTLNDRDEKQWALFNLKNDRSESENLVKSKPEIAAKLKKLWKSWANRVNALPFPEKR